MKTVVLFKAISPAQLTLLKASAYECLSVDFARQTKLYLKQNKSYAAMIARQWHLPLYGSAYVGGCRLPVAFIKQFPLESIGFAEHRQYAIPVSQLNQLNAQIIGKITIQSGLVHHRVVQASQPLTSMSELDLRA